MSIINFAEAISITEREKGLTAAQESIAAVNQLPVTVVEADRILSFIAAHMKANYPLSLAVAFAVALAQ